MSYLVNFDTCLDTKACFTIVETDKCCVTITVRAPVDLTAFDTEFTTGTGVKHAAIDGKIYAFELGSATVLEGSDPAEGVLSYHYCPVDDVALEDAHRLGQSDCGCEAGGFVTFNTCPVYDIAVLPCIEGQAKWEVTAGAGTYDISIQLTGEAVDVAESFHTYALSEAAEGQRACITFDGKPTILQLGTALADNGTDTATGLLSYTYTPAAPLTAVETGFDDVALLSPNVGTINTCCCGTDVCGVRDAEGNVVPGEGVAVLRAGTVMQGHNDFNSGSSVPGAAITFCDDVAVTGCGFVGEIGSDDCSCFALGEADYNGAIAEYVSALVNAWGDKAGNIRAQQFKPIALKKPKRAGAIRYTHVGYNAFGRRVLLPEGHPAVEQLRLEAEAEAMPTPTP